MTDAALNPVHPGIDPSKFRDPDTTADGSRRASVALKRLQTLWFNTGTLCNLECANCYIESSPTNDRLVYLSAGEVARLLDEADARGETVEIGFTGGEPFMNPDFIPMLRDALGRGYRVLVLTNAMRPMMKCAEPLLALGREFGDRLRVRVSIDHYAQRLHELERGAHAWERMLPGLDWLAANGFHLSVAGRTMWQETEAQLRAGFARLFAERGIAIDAEDPERLVLFPEMDGSADVPEITTACWGILDVSPDAMMCATSRMVVKRKGEAAATVVPCTLLPYDPRFDLGETLEQAAADVPLNHPHCARFCVLGGGSCSVG
jgi:uncharacterized Fe-S cluster-containing radical SAM superfamily protein